MRRFCAFACAAGFLACSQPGRTGPKLTIESDAPLTLAVGDTSDVLIVSKVTVDANGRETTDSDYGKFKLVSSDTSVAKIVDSRRVLGVAAGTANVTADDDRSSLVS